MNNEFVAMFSADCKKLNAPHCNLRTSSFAFANNFPQ